MITNEITKRYVEYLSAKCVKENVRRSLDKHYLWEFRDNTPREKFKFKPKAQTPAEKTLELRKFLNDFNKKFPERESELAEYFIKDWGGIHSLGNVVSVVKQCKELCKKGSNAEKFPFERISSWSKWLSIVCPDWALVFDARVAYSLNGINYLTGGDALIFPVPAGRNTSMEIIDSATILLMKRLGIKGNGSSATDLRIELRNLRKDHFLPKDKAYAEYLRLVSSIHNELGSEDAPLACTEMLLFSIADTIVLKDLLENMKEPALVDTRRHILSGGQA